MSRHYVVILSSTFFMGQESCSKSSRTARVNSCYNHVMISRGLVDCVGLIPVLSSFVTRFVVEQRQRFKENMHWRYFYVNGTARLSEVLLLNGENG